MRLKWLGTATILLESGKHRLIFDPYLRELNKDREPFPVNELNGINAIFITHPHLDHFADINKIMEYDQSGNTPVYVCKRGIEIAGKQGFQTDRMKKVEPGDVVTFGELKVTVYQGRHCIFDSMIMKETLLRSLSPKNLSQALEIEKLNKEFYIGTNDIYGYEIEENDKKLFIMGSANMPDTTVNPTEMDLLVFPYQGRSDMETYSLEFIKTLRPKKVLLDHYDDAFPPVSKQMNPDAFINNVKQYNPEIPVIKTMEGKWYNI